MKIGIISSSIREKAQSPRIATFFKSLIESQSLAEVDLIDLSAYQFPIFTERLRFMANPPENLLELSSRIKQVDALIIVTPEYNGGYPASLKNIIDVFFEEWKRKPIGISMVSAGPFAGAQVITSLLFTLWKLGATMVPSMFPVAQVQDFYTPEGIPLKDQEVIEKRAKAFVEEIIWYTQKLKA